MVPLTKSKLDAALEELKELCVRIFHSQAPFEADDEAKEQKEIKDGFAEIEKAENYIENL